MWLALVTDFCQLGPPPTLKEIHCHIVCPSAEAVLAYKIFALESLCTPASHSHTNAQPGGFF